MQFQVPQFIETEDKIVGPFTIKQFIYLVCTAGFAGMLFFILNTVVWFLIAAPLVGIGMALAFIKINGRSFIDIALSAAKYYWEPQTYVWQPDHPQAQKAPAASGSSTFERIVAGLALKSAWQEVETGSKTPQTHVGEPASHAFGLAKERYEIFRSIAGQRKGARRIDYR